MLVPQQALFTLVSIAPCEDCPHPALCPAMGSRELHALDDGGVGFTRAVGRHSVSPLSKGVRE